MPIISARKTEADGYTISAKETFPSISRNAHSHFGTRKYKQTLRIIAATSKKWPPETAIKCIIPEILNLCFIVFA